MTYFFLVEAKAGAAATIASPAIDFDRHTQSVQDLVLKAYRQCKRFFDYLNSADEVPIYRRANGRYEECGRVRRADYRVMVPIGLTIESFSPFSAYCKELPEITPLLGRHGFVSLSIDDLFVLKRLLPTPGEFAHYMEVRQSVAAIRRAHLFDEVDHLGAYLKKNRFDLDISEQVKGGKASLVIWDGMSDTVDRAFEGRLGRPTLPHPRLPGRGPEAAQRPRRCPRSRVVGGGKPYSRSGGGRPPQSGKDVVRLPPNAGQTPLPLFQPVRRRATLIRLAATTRRAGRLDGGAR